jgi:hypothetical protein
MTNTPRLALPAIEAAQAQKHVTHNEALTLLDALTQLAVESRTLTTPPGTPADGACYIPAAGATGAWAGWSGQIALFSGGGWIRVIPVSGLKAWVKAERLTIIYEDGIWRDGIALTVHGGRVTLRAKEEEVTLAGAFVDTTDAASFRTARLSSVWPRAPHSRSPARPRMAIGIAGNTTQFGNLLGVTLNSTNNGVVGPTAFYADTKVRVTANGGNFTAGKVRLIIYFLEMSIPSS